MNISRIVERIDDDPVTQIHPTACNSRMGIAEEVKSYARLLRVYRRAYRTLHDMSRFR